MCGIAGFIHRDNRPADPVILRQMTDTIAHRGPDGEGQWCEGAVGLGHRRLAILDLTAAAQQPMISTDQRYVLVYNGEIYNFAALRSALQAEGYQFRSRSDTEVVLGALAAWGVAALSRFNGMFAFALWDRTAQRLLLARDRYGIKPLYYALQDGNLAFGSEQKAILAMPGFRRALDPAALLEYFTFQNLFTDRTLLRDVRLLPAGHYAEYDLRAAVPELRLTRYWDFHFREPTRPAADAEYVAELDRLFQQAVTRQLIADVPVGCYLSGGLDSGAIATVAARAQPGLKTFTCGFDLSSASGIELAYDERAAAAALAARLGTDHTAIMLRAGDMERVMPRLAWHLEEPRVGQSYPNFYAAELARRSVKVVLSGGGGDELFGGYPWRYYRAAVCDNFADYIEKYYNFWQRLIPNNAIQKVFAPIWPEMRDIWTRDIFRAVFSNHDNMLERPEDYINHSLYFEAKTFLHGLLVVEDKLSMAHGLEARLPFLDNDLVDFAMQCPVRLKLNNLQESVRINENHVLEKKAQSFHKTNDGKKILRDVMRGYIPADIADAEKQGFSGPDGSWFKGESMDYVRRMLLTGAPRIYEFIDPDAVRTLVEEHMNGQKNRRLLIWSLLSFEHFLVNFLD
ncbi:MAG: asparagine synthase (glutamine-hydrolyzing) [Alphaproteobacteria bacterium]